MVDKPSENPFDVFRTSLLASWGSESEKFLKSIVEPLETVQTHMPILMADHVAMIKAFKDAVAPLGSTMQAWKRELEVKIKIP